MRLVLCAAALLAPLLVTAGGLDEAVAAKRLAEMRARLGAGFVVEREGLFLVAGNLPRAQFDRVREQTIQLCAEVMWASYFERKPDYVITVYLFADDRSYRHWAKELFGDTQVSHFGYYRPWDQTLVMNIGTGTGTLVHEMTHALMKPDFPDAPTWFEEGLASLHEQCRVERDALVGLENWRLPGLQKAIEDGRLVPLEKLVGTTAAEFRGANEGLHYAEARYLVLYLQQKGLVRDFYRRFRGSRKDDPTGAKTLAIVAGRPLPELQVEWVRWVATLRFPPRE